MVRPAVETARRESRNGETLDATSAQRVAFHGRMPPPVATVPSMTLPFTWPRYSLRPAVKTIRSPFSFPRVMGSARAARRRE
jgi:hypothetical protein